ncbi:MAG: hypothetical protein II707_08430 [Spirochaetales bacterium]|nr:hypothetical protein [Spirochaetales bacterium]
MKPIIISLLLLSIFVGVAFAGESSFSGKYRTPLEKLQIRKKAGAITELTFGSIFALGGSALAGLTIWMETMGAGFLYAYAGVMFIVPLAADGFLLGASLFLYHGILKLACMSQSTFDTAKLISFQRNAGIILLATSAVPLSGVAASVALMIHASTVNSYGYQSFIFPNIFCGLFALAHIIVGACLIGKYYYKYGDWAMRHLMPEVALTRDEVSLGMRIRI